MIFKDTTHWTIQTLEVSLARKTIVFDVIGCEPAHTVSGVAHTMSLKTITSTKSTFFEWTTDFTNDVTANVIADNGMKKQEALEAFPMRIFVMTLGNDKLPIDVRRTDSIDSIKDTIHRLVDRSPDEQHLVYLGQALRDGFTFEELDIVAGMTLHDIEAPEEEEECPATFSTSSFDPNGISGVTFEPPGTSKLMRLGRDGKKDANYKKYLGLDSGGQRILSRSHEKTALLKDSADSSSHIKHQRKHKERDQIFPNTMTCGGGINGLNAITTELGRVVKIFGDGVVEVECFTSKFTKSGRMGKPTLIGIVYVNSIVVVGVDKFGLFDVLQVCTEEDLDRCRAMGLY